MDAVRASLIAQSSPPPWQSKQPPQGRSTASKIGAGVAVAAMIGWKLVKGALILTAGGLLAVGFFAYQYENSPEQLTKRFDNLVTSDLLTQYRIAEKNGSKMDVCMQAGAVALGFLQAHDADQYAHWKRVQKVDCEIAGIPVE